MTWLSFMLDSQLFGLHPGGFLLTNLLFHIANTLLLFLWLHRTTGALGRSFLVAALFALHPLHVESVAWVTERKDVLSTFFWLLTMYAYLWYVARPGIRRYLLVLACFSLGLMAKPMLVTLPVVLLLLDYWPLGRWPGWASPASGSGTYLWTPIKRLLWEKAPMLALAALFSVVTYHAKTEAGVMWTLQGLSLPTRLANALVPYFTYLVKMVWPSHLAIFYPLPENTLRWWQWLGAGLALAVLSLLIVWQSRRRPYLLVGWLWYLGTLVPVSGLVQVGYQAMADRFTYVPLIGLFIIVAWGLVDLTAGWRHARVLLRVSAGVVLSALAVCTWLQLRHWQNSISLFEHTLRVTKNNFIAHNQLGMALASQGQVAQAIAHYSEALRLWPNFDDALKNLELALTSQGQVAQIDPKYAMAYNNRGWAYYQRKSFDKALADFNKAIELNSKIDTAYNYRGLIYYQQKDYNKAIDDYNNAIKINPTYADPYNNRGVVNSHKGDYDAAIADYTKAIQLNPDLAVAYHNRAHVYLKKKDCLKAEEDERKAPDLKYNVDPEFLKNLRQMTGSKR